MSKSNITISEISLSKISPDEIEISNQQLRNIYNFFDTENNRNLQLSQDLIENNVKEEIKDLVKEANLFYVEMQKKYEELKSITQTLNFGIQQIKTKENKTTINYYYDLAKKAETTQNLIKTADILANNFSQKVKNFLGQKPTKVLYSQVGKNLKGEKIQLALIERSELLRLYSSGKGDYDLRLYMSQKAIKENDKKESLYQKYPYLNPDKAGRKELNKVFDEVVWRYTKHVNNKKHIILWTAGKKEEENEWNWGKAETPTLNYGNFIEGYARCILTRNYPQVLSYSRIEQQGNKDRPSFQPAIEKFMEALDANDNVSGMYQNDINDFAIKSQTASTEGIEPALIAAREIIKENNASKEQMLKLLQDLAEKEKKKGTIFIMIILLI